MATLAQFDTTLACINKSLAVLKNKPNENTEDTMTAQEKIKSLVDQELEARIPSFIKNHASKATAVLIKREYPDLCAEASGEMTAEREQELANLVNKIYREHMAKHSILNRFRQS